jgi:hypothetical protein
MHNFKIYVFLKKHLVCIILFSTFEQKTAFLAIYMTKRARNRPFFLPFLYISGSLEGVFDFYDP